MNISFFGLMLLIIIYHGKLGMQIIFEDYISNKLLRKNIIIIINILSYILMIISLLSLFYIQLSVNYAS